jgi:hypothetical protein
MADEAPKITDRRSSRRGGPSGIIVPTASQASAAMRGRLPREGVVMPAPGLSGRRDGLGPDSELDEMRRNRAVNRRTGMRRQASTVGGGGGGFGGGADVSFATGRPRDPMFYWRQNNIPYDVTKDEELKKIRAFCRLLYLTHPIVAACIDIFSKFPLQGMNFECKDEQLIDFHGSLFFDELKYEDYLLDVGREYWLTGEAWPLGSWNPQLGVWDGDELLQPDDVEVERSPFLKDPRFLIRLPATLRKVLQERSPRWEYDALMKAYPELAAYAGENALMPVSNVLLKQLKFKGDTFHKRGLPILMRGFRAIVQEEMLNAAMDAIADRLYTPLILAKLGASASDLGTEAPWIPTKGDLDDFEEALDAALAGDFRILTHHFAIDMAPVFGRENMPDMSNDFERIEDRILQVFGLSRTILQGADSGETYAADALNRDVVTQLLTHYQRGLKEFQRGRALVVAEAQEHFDYDVRNGKRYVQMEEILEVDEETGEERIVEQPKLLVPDLTFDTMTLQDEQTERQFIEALCEAGVPISYKRRLLGTGIDLDDEAEAKSNEVVQLAVQEQETRRETFKGLRDANLPVPPDLAQDFQPKAAQVTPTLGQGQDLPIPTLGQDPLALPALAPTPDDLAAAEEDPNAPVDPTMGQLIPMPNVPEPGASRPPESDEQRANMPKPASRKRVTGKKIPGTIKVGIRQATRENYVPPDNSIEDVHDEDGELVRARPENYRPTGKFGPPAHLGMRRYVEIDEEAKSKDSA